MRLPPMSTFAPWETAPSTCFRRSTSADSVDKGPSVVFSSSGSPGFRAASAALKLLQELVGELFDDDEPLRRAAGLPRVVHPSPDRPLDGVFEIGVFEDDERVAAAEFHRGRLEVLSGARRDAPAGRDAAGQRDALDARIIDDAGPTDRARSADWYRGRPARPRRSNSFSKAIAHCGTMPACFTSRTLPAIRCGPATRASW